MAFKVKLLDGTAALPAVTFENDPDSGLYLIADGRIGVSIAGAKVAELNASGLDFYVGANKVAEFDATSQQFLVGGVSVADFQAAAAVLLGTLQWGTGAAIASSNKVRPDYAGFHYGDDTGTSYATDRKDIYHLVEVFASKSPEVVSSADLTSHLITFGDSRVYGLHFDISGSVAIGGALFEVEVFNISQTTKAITGITKANPGVVTCVGHGFANDDNVLIRDVTGMVEVNDHIYTVANKADDSFQLVDAEGANIDSRAYTDYVSGGTCALATGIVEAYNDFPNGTIGAVSGSAPLQAVAGDHCGLFFKNYDNTNDMTVYQSHLWITAL